jgi:hypothetical protein
VNSHAGFVPVSLNPTVRGTLGCRLRWAVEGGPGLGARVPRAGSWGVWCRAGLLALSVALATGCGHRSEHDHNHAGSDEPYVGHIIPPHKPPDFPAAVQALRELTNRLAGQAGVDDDPVSLGKSVEIAADIANWLPEIAADSDMPEEVWDQVNALAVALGPLYQSLLTGAAAADRWLTCRKADGVVADLERLLEASDPRWFVHRLRPIETETDESGSSWPEVEEQGDGSSVANPVGERVDGPAIPAQTEAGSSLDPSSAGS